MASIVYAALLFVFLMGAGITYMNDAGFYCNTNHPDTCTKLPDSGLTSDQRQANDTSQALMYEAQHPSATSTWNQIGIGFHSLFGGVMSLFTFGFLLQDMGVPVGLWGFLLSPMALVISWWAIGFWTGREPE